MTIERLRADRRAVLAERELATPPIGTTVEPLPMVTFDAFVEFIVECTIVDPIAWLELRVIVRRFSAWCKRRELCAPRPRVVSEWIATALDDTRAVRRHRPSGTRVVPGLTWRVA